MQPESIGSGDLPPIHDDEIYIANVNQQPQPLAGNKYRVPAIQGVDQKQRAATDRKKPERHWHHALSRAFGCNPLHHKPHREKCLRDKAERYPPVELDNEDVVHIVGQIVHAASAGQSAAVRSGVRASRGAIVATLDGDGQNDPAFLPELIAAIENGGEGMGLAAGQRVGRKDTGFKRLQSRIANRVRGTLLRDGTRDTGCGLKAFRREVFLMLPYFDGLHRFLPALVRREGYEIGYVDVIDRPRRSGMSNYGFFDRLWIGIMDLVGVWWLIRRKKPTPDVTEVTA